MTDFLVAAAQWIVQFQTLGAWLTLPMEFFSFLGSEEFFLLVLPVLYWSVDTKLGMRVGAILLLNTGINNMFKVFVAWPRPYWVSTEVVPYAAESSFGVPSGHSQTAVAVWGTIAMHLRRPWVWALSVLIIVLIGVSRLFLGVHFIHDVLIGWTLGALVLWVFHRSWEPIGTWAKAFSVWKQIGLAFLLSLVLIGVFALGAVIFDDTSQSAQWAVWFANAERSGERPHPNSMESIITPSAALFGLLAGLAWLRTCGGFEATGTFWQRATRYLVGVIGVLVLWYGLGAVFPRTDDLLAYSLRYLRYALIGGWVSAFAPILFIRLKL
jgi:membrane-associated phospholipid phosphatase